MVLQTIVIALRYHVSMSTPTLNQVNHGKIYVWAYALMVLPAYFVLQYFDAITESTDFINTVFLTLISTVIPALVTTALILVVRTYVFKR